ncbi:glycosyltransferase family 4 protein [Sphingomonas sanguinis]|uniref:Glycosyltransferase family 4 protein n=1 Tax=Sphingomonas sanguinis TaxID=33051 RepID=A0ABU5LSV2_9SPHN|nr:glycosyltransferase family 1 protein [Sphingomonas sanguinis]MDZ7283004.1 glycosyltransferase family 4 protein [Sphingomonas sanguinis]
MNRILIDGRPIRPPISGVARYCLSLGNAFAARQPDDLGLPDMLVQYDNGRNISPDALDLALRQIEYRPFRHRKLQNVMFEFLPSLVGRGALGSYDLVHETYFANTVTRPGQRKIATIHDVIPIDHPEFFNRNNRIFTRRNFYRQARETSAIIAVSHFTKQRILELADIAPDKIHVIGCGVDLPPRTLIDGVQWPIRDQVAQDAQYGLYIGNLEPRKNLDALIEAWAKLGSAYDNAKLVVVGRLNYQAEATVERGRALLGNRFVFIGPASEAEKWALLSHATFLALPSLYEGYGIPIIEAYACGVPAIFARNSSMTELAVDERQMFDGSSRDEIVVAIRRVLDREAWVQAAVVDRIAWVERNRWSDIADQVANVYRNVLGA